MAQDKDGGRLTRKMRAMLAEARAYLSPRKLRQALALAVRPAWNWAYSFSPSFAGLGRRWWQARGIRTSRRRAPMLRTLETLEPRVLLSGSYLYVNTDWNLVADTNNNGIMDKGDNVSNSFEDNSLQNLTFGTDAFANIGDAVMTANSSQTIVIVSGAYGSAYSTTVDKSVTVEGWKDFAAHDAGVANTDVTQGNVDTSLTTVFNGASLTITNPVDVTVEGIGFNGAPTTGAVRVNGSSASATILDDAFNTGSVGVRIDSGSATLESSNTFGSVTTGVLINTGGTATDISSTFTNTPTAVDVEGGSATVSGATITGGITGVKIGSGSLIINSTDAPVDIANAITGVQVAGGTASVSGAVISGNTTGIDVASGALTIGTGDSIIGGTTGLSVSGSTASITDNTLNDLSFSSQTGNYITLVGGALGGTGSQTTFNGNTLDASDAKFDGIVGSSLTPPTLAQFDNIEDHITDYLDDGTVGYISLKSGNVYVTKSSETANPNAIQRGVNVGSGDTVNVQAGTYVGDVVIGASMTIKGPNADFIPTKTDLTPVYQQAIVEPGADSSYDTSAVFLVQANDVTIEGLTIQGSNANFSSGGYSLPGGPMTYAAAGISNSTDISNDLNIGNDPGATNITGLTVQNNIIQDFKWAGVDGDTNGTGFSSYDNSIKDNYITGMTADSPAYAGEGVYLYDNFYASVANNVMTDVRTGVQVGNFYLALSASSTTQAEITGNNISAFFRGIYDNLQHESATGFAVTNNTVSFDSADLPMGYDSGLTTSTDKYNVYNVGLLVQSLGPTVSATIQGNDISGFIYGAEVWLATTGNTVTLTGGKLSGNTYGVYVTNNDPRFGAAGGAEDVIISDVTIEDSTKAGVYVQDGLLDSTVAVSATINGDTSITTNTTDGIGIEVSGANASAIVSGNDASISGNATGVLVSGGSATISGNHIYDNTTGIDFTSGGSGSVSGNDFTGTSANGTDLIVDSNAGTVADDGGNKFAGTQYISDLEKANTLNAVTDFFDGVEGSGLTLDQGWAAENKISDYLDNPSDGYVELNASNVYVTQDSENLKPDAIQRGVDVASAGNTVHVQSGNYVGDVVIGTSLTLDGGGVGVGGVGGANVTAPAAASNAAIISVAAANVTVEGFNITVNQPDAGAGIAALDITASNIFDGLKILDNAITTTGSGGALLNPLAGTARYSAGIAVLANGSPNVTISGNTVLASDDSILDRGIWLSQVHGTIGGTLPTDGNTLQGSYEDLEDSFATGGLTTIENNHFDGVGVTITEPNTSSPIDVSGNTFTSAFNFVDDASLLVSHDYNTTSPVTISGNTFNLTADSIGVLSAASTGVSVTANTFTPVAGATGTVAIDVDTMMPNSQANPPVVDSISITGNQFNNPNGEADATAIRIANDNANASFGAITIGGSGTAANTFSENLANFIVDAPPSDSVSFSGDVYAAAKKGDVAVDIDASDNVFGVSSHHTLAASNFSLPDYYEVEDKIVDGVDYSGAGLVRIDEGQVFVTPNSFLAAAGTSTASIQRGIDVAKAGDTLNLETGTYLGQVAITKDLTLIGAGEGQTIIQAPDSLAATGDNVFTYSSDPTKQSVLTIQPDASHLIVPVDVTVKNLTVDGANKGDAVVPGNDFVGIGIYNSDATINGVKVINVADATIDGAQRGRAIFVGNDSTTDHTVTIEHSTITGYQKNGIDVRGDGLAATIKDNTITGYGHAGVSGQNGIVVGFGAVGTVTGNTIGGNVYGGTDPDNYATGVLLYDAGAGTQVENNIAITGNDVGVEVESDTAHVQYTISGNTISDSAVADVYLMTNVGATTVTGNTLMGNATGVGLGIDSSASNLGAITGNTFTGGTAYIDNQSASNINATTDTFDVGTAGAQVAGSALSASQAFAVEDKITDAIDQTGLGFVQLQTGEVFVAHSSETLANPDAIQRGVDAAAAGDTVNVEGGTALAPDIYVGQVSITKDLPLIGAGEGLTIIEAPASLATSGDNVFTYAGSIKQSVLTIQPDLSQPTVPVDVTVQGLTVDGHNKGNAVTGPNDFVGIGIHNSDATINGVAVTNVADTTIDGAQRGRAIFVGNDSTTDHTVTIEHSTITGYQKNGIDVRGPGLTATISDNTITGANASDPGVNAQNGIVLGFGATGTISGNTVSGDKYDSANPQAAAILLYQAGAPVLVTDNTLTASDYGIAVFESSAIIGDTTTIDGVTTTHGNALTGDTIGLDVDQSTGQSKVVAEYNAITGDGQGVVIADGAPVDLGTDASDSAHADFTGLMDSDAHLLSSAGNNNLTGYRDVAAHYAIDDQNTGSQPDVLAEDNDFGPYPLSDPAIVGEVIHDHADNAADTTVYYMPALDGQTAPTTVYVNAAWAGTTFGVDADGADGGAMGNGIAFGFDEFSNIQDAVDALASGAGEVDTVNVYNGTYAEDVTVNKVTASLTIQGQDESLTKIDPVAGGGAVQTAFFIESSNVTIKDLTINGAAIDGNAFATGVQTAYTPTMGYQSISSTAYNSLTVEDSTIENISGDGVFITTQGTGNQILNDTFTNDGGAGGYAIHVHGGDTTIQGNTITGAGSDSDGVGVNAEYDYSVSPLTEYAPLMTIQDNTISDVNVGLYLAAMANGSMVGGPAPTMDNTDPANSINVTAGGSGAAGIIVEYAGGGVTVQRNTITAKGDAMGIILFADAANAVLLKGNDITSSSSSADTNGAAAGILVTDDNSLPALGEPGSAPTTNATITGNDITGFTTGIEVQSQGQLISANIGDSALGDSNTIDGTSVSDSTGVLVTGAGASAAIIDNNSTIANNTVGIDVESDGTATIDGNVFSGNTTDVKIGTTGSVTSLTGNTFTATSLYIDNEAAANLNATTGNTFGSVTPSTGSLADDYLIENKIVDGIDQSSSGLVSIVTGNLYVAHSSEVAPQGSAGSIHRAVALASAGDTVNVEAGTYSDNVTIDKRITLAGAGDGSDAAGNTIIDSASPGSPVITITASGLDADHQLTVEGVRVTGASGGSGDQNAGVLITPGNGSISFVTLNNVASVGNSGAGITINGTGSASNITISNSAVSGNSAEGIRAGGVNSTLASLNGLTIEGTADNHMTIENNVGDGIVVYGLGDGTSDTNISISYVDLSGDGSTAAYNPNPAEINMYHVTGNVTVQNVTITADSYAYGMQFEGTGYSVPAGDISLTNVKVSGTVNKGGIVFQNYENLDSVSLSGVSITATAPWGSLIVDDEGAPLNLGNTAITVPADAQTAKQQAIVLWNTGGVNATGAKINGVDLSANPSLSALYAVEDAVLDGIDVSGLGIVELKADNLYVTPNSFYAPYGTTAASIQRGIDAATAGDTVNVEAGIYTGDVEITKSLQLEGAQANMDPGANGWGEMAPETIIIGAGVNAPIAIDSAVDNVTINGFVVESPIAGSGNYNSGIYIPGSTGITIQDNIITDNTAGIAVGNSLVTIENNLIEDNNAGLNDQPGAGTGVEFYAATSQASHISDNHFTNNKNNDVLLAAAVPISNITISGNTMTASTGIFLLDSSNIDITANSASAMIGTPVYVGGGDTNIDIGQNNFSDNPGNDAIVVDNPYSSYGVAANGSGISIHNNFLDSNATGVDITADSITDSVAINQNSISGSTNAGVDNESTVTVDATENWWGSSNGPDTTLNTYMNPTTGDKVVGSNVNIVKWLTDSTDTDAAAGFQPNVDNNVPTVNSAEDAANNDNEGSAQSVDATVTTTTDPVTYYWSVTKNGTPFGTSATVGQTTSLTNTYSFTPDDNGTYVVTITVVDQDGASDTTSTTLTINNVVPTAALTAVTDPQIEGSAEQFTASATDPSSVDTTAEFTYNWTVSKQHGSDDLIPDYASGTSGSGAATATINFTPDDDGTYIITVTATDKDGGVSTAATDVITVANLAPTASLSDATGPLLEGSQENLTASATDPSTQDTTAGFTYNWTISKQHGSVITADWATGSSGPAATAPIAFTPDDDGTYIVTVTATDKDTGVSDAVTETLVITNVNPTATITGTPSTPVNEGSPIALGSTVTDPSTADTTAGFAYLWTVNKDGDPYTVTDYTASAFTFAPDDNGNYVVTLTATDKDGGFDTVSSSAITVLNVAPADLSFHVTTPINENDSTSLSGSFSDPGSADNHTLSINWGDGSDVQIVSLDPGVLGFSGITHQYLQNNVGNAPYTISVKVTDKDGAATTATTPIEVDDVAPAIDLSASATSTNEGSLYTLKLGAITDPGSLDVVTGYSINWGDGNTSNFIDGGSPAGTTQTHTYEDGPITENISVTLIETDPQVSDAHGGAGTFAVTVNNVDPTATFANFGTISEGSSNTVFFSNASDPSPVDTANGLRYAYDLNNDGQFNDGAGDGTYTGSAGEPSTLNIPASFFSTPGPHTIVGRIIDKDGGYNDYTTTFDVDNVAPTVHLVSPANASTNSVFATSGSWSDPGNDAPYSATVDYGDGSGVQTLTLTAAQQTSHTFNLSHTYTTANSYNITVKIADSTGYATPAQFAPMTGTGTMTVNVANTTLRVNSVTATGNGFDIAFNRAVDINDIALYGSGSVVSPISVQLQTVGGGSTTVNGSLVWDAGTNIAHWIQTRGNLVNGSYMVTLTSGTSGDNFHDASANALDGDSNGTAGDNYSSTIVVNNPVILSIPNFARGPGQAVVTNSEGTLTGATGLPVTISDGAGVESVHFVLDYDPNVLTITTDLATDLVTPGLNWAVTVNSSTPGVLDILVYSTNGSTLGSGSQAVLTFTNVSVKTTAAYGAGSLLSFSSVLLNEALTNPIPVIAAETEAKIVDLGDTNNASQVNSADALNISRVVVGLDTGFAADPLTDPVLIGDLTGDGTLSGIDAADASRMFSDPDSQLQVPTPLGVGTGGIAGHDPEVESGLGSTQTITAGADSNVQASIQIEDDANGLSSADLIINYDSSLLTLTDGGVALSNALHSLGWGMTEGITTAGNVGTLKVGIYSAFSGQPITTTGALDLIDLTFQTGSTLGVSTLGIPGQDLNGVDNILSMTTNPGSITIAAPSVVGGVSVSGSAWQPAFLNYLASSGVGSATLGYAVTNANNTTDLPWVNLNTINIQFSENVTITDGPNALAIYGVNNPSYTATSFSYNSTTHVATWTFAQPFTADKLLLDLNSAAITDAAGNPLAGGTSNGDFQFHLNILPGDTDNSGAVNSIDTDNVRALQFTGTTRGAYSIFDDLDGNGSINSIDTDDVRAFQFTHLPSGNPVIPVPPGPATVDAGDTGLVADIPASGSEIQSDGTGSNVNVGAPVILSADLALAPVAAAPVSQSPVAAVPEIVDAADVSTPAPAMVANSPETSAPTADVAEAADVADAATPVAAAVGTSPIADIPARVAIDIAATAVTPAPAFDLMAASPEIIAPVVTLQTPVAEQSTVVKITPIASVAKVVSPSTTDWSRSPLIEQAGTSSVSILPETSDGEVAGILAQAVSDASPGFAAPAVTNEVSLSDELVAALGVESAPAPAIIADSTSAPTLVSAFALPKQVSLVSLTPSSHLTVNLTNTSRPLPVQDSNDGLQLQGTEDISGRSELTP